MGFEAAMKIFELTKGFPKEERKLVTMICHPEQWVIGTQE